MGEQLLLIDQFLHIVERRTDVIMVEAIRQRVHDAVTIRFFVQRNNLVDEIVYEMNTSAVNIQHDVVAVQFILMYHLPIPSETDAPAFRHGAITLRLPPYSERRLVALLLTLLIRDTARCFAGRLARCLALAATVTPVRIDQFTCR